MLKEMKLDFSQLSQIVISHSTSIKHLETQHGTILAHLKQCPNEGLPSDMVANLKGDNQQCMAITTCTGKVIEGAIPLSNVELGKGVSISSLEVEDGDVIVNEEGKTLGNPKVITLRSWW